MRNNKIKDIKGLCEYIWYLEDKYDLFNLEINNIHPWAVFRMDLYYKIGQKHKVFNRSAKIGGGSNKPNKAINFFRLLKQSLINNSYFNLRQVEVLVFSHPRSKLVEAELIDPYTYYLKKDLIKNNISFLEFEFIESGLKKFK